MERRASAPTLLVLSAVFFGIMAFLSKVATRSFDGAAVAAVRFAVGLGITLSLVAVRRVQLRPRSYRLLCLRGALGGSAVLLYYLSIEHMAVGLATLLNYTSPVFTIFISRIFLGERLSLRGVLALALAGTGVVLVVHGQPTTGPVPAPTTFWLAVALTSSVLSAGAVTTIRAMRRGSEPEAAWDIFAFFCGVGFLVTAPMAHRFHVPSALESVVLLGVGTAAMVGQITMNMALRWVPAPVHGITAQLAVVIASGLGIAFLDEPWTAVSAGGAVLTLLGATWAATSHGR